MEIRRVKYEEYRMLIDVMNESFGFTTEEAKFEHILPKLYWPDNPTMVHIGAFEDGKLVSSIGIYPMELRNGDLRLRIACIGAVSTLPDHRGKGYFTAVMERVLSEARSMGFSLLFLGGNRVRYGRFGFEYGGRNFNVNISKRTRALIDPGKFEVLPYDENDAEVTARLLEIYNKKPMRVTRTAAEFGVTLRSWNSTVSYVKAGADFGISGYFSLKGGNVTEIGYDCPLDTMFGAILSLLDSANLSLPMSTYSPELLSKVDNYVVTHNHMFNILDESAVIRFLGADPARILPTLPLDHRTRVRLILGDSAYDSVTGTNIFISSANSG